MESEQLPLLLAPQAPALRESCCLRPQGCSWIPAGNALSPHPGLCFGVLCHNTQPIPKRDEPIHLHLHPCDCTLCPVGSKWICAKHVLSSQQRPALGCSGGPSHQRAAQRLQPCSQGQHFLLHHLPLTASSVLAASHYVFCMEGPTSA